MPTSYLGLPLCSGHANKVVWNPVVERVERKLSSWTANYLSIGGRITLIKSPFKPSGVLSISFKVSGFSSQLDGKASQEFSFGREDMRRRNFIFWTGPLFANLKLKEVCISYLFESRTLLFFVNGYGDSCL